MPNYELECSQCGHQFEGFYMPSEYASVKCPLCNSDTKVKISGGAGFNVKKGKCGNYKNGYSG